MVFYQKKITIINIRKPTHRSLNHDLQWFGTSLGLFNMRDKDRSCFRTFIELVKAAKERKPLSSDELALRLGLSRGTVIHHINKLIDSGIVLHEGNRYLLRVDSLKQLIQELKEDLQRNLNDLEEIAVELDGKLGL